MARPACVEQTLDARYSRVCSTCATSGTCGGAVLPSSSIACVKRGPDGSHARRRPVSRRGRVQVSGRRVLGAFVRVEVLEDHPCTCVCGVVQCAVHLRPFTSSRYEMSPPLLFQSRFLLLYLSMLTTMQMSSENMFDMLPLIAKSSSSVMDEVQHYLSTDAEYIAPDQDVLSWWRSKAKTYPWLSCMAHDYLSIPGTT